MTRIVYVNGAYVPEDQATVSVFDRGFLFADGVYEVTAVLDCGLVDFDGHLARLDRSLGALNMAWPVSRNELAAVHRELIARNSVESGAVYMQVTRGVAERDFVYPENTPTSLVAFTQARDLVNSPLAETGISVITLPDIRWQRRDIKSIALLAQAMGKQAAAEQGAYEGWLVEDGYVTEGTSSNAYIVTADDRIVTRQLSSQILAGVTRAALLQLARETGITIEERPFKPEEAYAAKEAFLTSSSTFVYPIVRIDGKAIGTGTPGPVARRLRELYIDAARKTAAAPLASTA
ncbi:MAG: D-amino-acid transaminase [Alphaproteobacteria bacterium]|nr:D-amino-acid transaminase [Alphaproteobacteria bacterium]